MKFGWRQLSVLSPCKERGSLVPIKILTDMSVAKLQPLYTVCVRLVAKPSLTLATTWTGSQQSSSVHRFSKGQVDCHFLLQAILPTQESDPTSRFPTLQLDSLLQSHQRSLSVHWCQIKSRQRSFGV